MPFYKSAVNFRKTAGFTLIELLVVIAIIGILASFAIASFTSAQAKGRDARRKSDFDAIKKALQMYYSDNGHFPITTNWVYSGSGGSWIPELTSVYIKTVPLDPKNTTPGCWTEDSTCFNYQYYSADWCGLNGKSYILATRLEAYNKSDLSQQPYINPDGSFCSYWRESATIGLYVIAP